MAGLPIPKEPLRSAQDCPGAGLALPSPEAERDSVHPLVALHLAAAAHSPQAQPEAAASCVPGQEALDGGWKRRLAPPEPPPGNSASARPPRTCSSRSPTITTCAPASAQKSCDATHVACCSENR